MFPVVWENCLTFTELHETRHVQTWFSGLRWLVFVKDSPKPLRFYLGKPKSTPTSPRSSLTKQSVGWQVSAVQVNGHILFPPTLMHMGMTCTGNGRGFFLVSTPESNICTYTLYTCSYRASLIISRNNLWFSQAETLNSCLPKNPPEHREMARNQGLCQVSINCTDFQRQKTSMVQLKCSFVNTLASNVINTKYPNRVSLVLQDWRWSLKQSFDSSHLE